MHMHLLLRFVTFALQMQMQALLFALLVVFFRYLFTEKHWS